MKPTKFPARPGRRRPTSADWPPVHDPRWREKAHCLGRDGELFFPEGDQPTAIATDICRHCQVREDCLAYAMGHDERYGIWGGLTEAERAELRAEHGGARHGSPGDDGPVAA